MHDLTGMTGHPILLCCRDVYRTSLNPMNKPLLMNIEANHPQNLQSTFSWCLTKE